MNKKILTTLFIFALAIIAGFFAKGLFQVEKQNNVNVYFLKVIDGDSSYVAVSRKVEKEQNPFDVAIKSLLKGPSSTEQKNGIYSEIPSDVKLIEIKHKGNSYIINITQDFEFGGGADTMNRRVQQLIKTAIEAANNKKVYLELEGEEVEVIGGEGILIKQPLDKNL